MSAAARLHVHIIGAGLIGASIGLALRGRGHVVTLEDRDHAAAQLAVALGAGAERYDDAPVDVVVVAVPPTAVGQAVAHAQHHHRGSTVMDIASIKTGPLADVAASGADQSRFVGSHPMAGRERSGPGAARADLFLGRPWVVCPTPTTNAGSLEVVHRAVVECGAEPVEMSAEDHDRAVAVVSHLPQIVASLTARQLLDAPEAYVQLAGAGVRDTTRVAASDPTLWLQILQGNAAAVTDVIRPLIEDLQAIQHELDDVVSGGEVHAGPPLIYSLLSDGRSGRSRLPGKHGAPHATYATVPVVVPDRPGELARLLVAAGAAEVNVEDISIEHSPGAPVGLVELAVAPVAVAHLTESLRADGWDVHVEESRLAD